MKKIFVALFCVLLISCEENLNPYGEYKEKYILNCIIRGDTTFQTATLSKTYSVLNNDPYSGKEDPSIKNAIIRIWNGDAVVTLKDTTIERPQPSNYKYPYSLYYTNKFLPDANYKLEIEVLLKDGTKLKSFTTPPKPIQFAFVEKNIPFKNKESVTYRWNDGLLDQTYVTKFMIYYKKKIGTQQIFQKKEIPIKYEEMNDRLIPIFPAPNNNNFLALHINTISEAMRSISEGDNEKSNYEIIAAVLEVISLDKNLSTYFNSTSRSGDAFSVKLDETDFSNIDRGFGIFGIYMTATWVTPFTPQYIRSFGYKPDPGYVDYPFESIGK